MTKDDLSGRLAHQPVMAAEVVKGIEPRPDGHYLDCTVGAGGHSRALLEAGGGRVFGLDRDSESFPVSRVALASWADRVKLFHADFREIDQVLDEHGITTVDGAVADLGVSSMQLDTQGRGFSFRRDDVLDMRMDRTEGSTAAELLRDVPEKTLANLIFQYGEERYSRRIARAIVTERQREPFKTTAQLATLIRRVVPRNYKRRIDPATRTFHALWIWVNAELDRLVGFVRAIFRRLRTGARFAVLAFHSLEDRVIKTVFRELHRGQDLPVRILTKRPLRPSEDEVGRNPRSRSARLRIAERLA